MGKFKKTFPSPTGKRKNIISSCTCLKQVPYILLKNKTSSSNAL